MARVKFDEKYVSAELERIGTALASPVTLYLIGGAAMIRYGLKAATKDIDVLLPTFQETKEMIQALSKLRYRVLHIDRLAPEYLAMFTSQILENADGFRWDIFHEAVCRKLRLSTGMIERSAVIFKSGFLTVRLISKEDIFLFKTVTERDDDETDLLLLARSKIDWEVVLKECINQSRYDLRCEIDLCDKLDKLETSYGLVTPIYSRISRAAQAEMDEWFEDKIIRELDTSPKTQAELLQRFKCEREILIPSLTNLEKTGKIKRMNDKYKLNK